MSIRTLSELRDLIKETIVKLEPETAKFDLEHAYSRGYISACRDIMGRIETIDSLGDDFFEDEETETAADRAEQRREAEA